MPTATLAGADGDRALRRQTRVDRVGRLPEQDGQRVLGLPQRVLEVGNLRLRLRQQRRRLAHVELARLAVLELDRGDAQALLLRLDVAPGHPDALLGRADVDVGRRDVGDDGHQRVVVGRDRVEVRGPVRLDAAPDLAPDVDLPRGGEEDVVVGTVDA